MPQYRIRIANDDLTFSAGHFITLEDGRCERLHGHTYRIVAEVAGPLDDSQCVVDFLVVRDTLRKIVGDLDHRMLLPQNHPAIRVTLQNEEVEATFANRRWVFPENNCLILPVTNTTTELLAKYVGEKLWVSLVSLGNQPESIEIELTEGSGSSAICRLP